MCRTGVRTMPLPHLNRKLDGLPETRLHHDPLKATSVRSGSRSHGGALVRKLFINTTVLALFFPSMIWLLFELGWIENVVGGPWFVLLALAVSAVPAYWVGRGIARAVGAEPGTGGSGHREPDADPQREAAAAGLLAGAGLLALGLCIASWTNHEHARRSTYVQATVVGRKHKEATPRTPAEEWRLIVEIRWKREDVLVSAGEWQRSPVGTRVSIRMLDGALGFPVVCSARLGGRCGGEPITTPERQ